MKTLLSLSVILATAKFSHSASASGIVSVARSHNGSTKWSYAGSHETGPNTNKCNIFVADVLKKAKAEAPNRWPIFYTPIGANEWADPNSSYLKNARCWKLCTGSPSRGDVIAMSGHVGIVTGYRKTTSASAAATPAGKVVENDWGFRSGSKPTCWRYQYSKWLC